MALLYVLLFIVLLLFALLAVPVEVEYAYDSKSRPRSTGLVVWMFGLVRFRPRRKKGQPGERKREAAPKRPGPRRSASARKRRARVILAAVRSEGFIRRVFKLLRAVLAATGLKQLRARLSLGLDDPADTGIVFSRLMPGLSLLYAMPQVDFVATPVFDRSAFETDMNIKLRMVPINYLNALVVFVFSRETFRAAGAALRAYRR